MKRPHSGGVQQPISIRFDPSLSFDPSNPPALTLTNHRPAPHLHRRRLLPQYSIQRLVGIVRRRPLAKGWAGQRNCQGWASGVR